MGSSKRQKVVRKSTPGGTAARKVQELPAPWARADLHFGIQTTEMGR
jgi:hypothetical protein